jgi:hypothetical protein
VEVDPQAIRILLLARVLAYMALVYVAFGLLVESTSRKPDSKLKAFARLICSPLTKPVAALSAAGTEYRSILRRTAAVVAGLWALLLVVSEWALRP